MKKLLLFAILALSINAFAQNKQPMLNLQHQPSKSMEDIQGRMDKERINKSHSPEDMLSAINPKSHQEQTIKHQTPDPLELIQIIDSIYSWQWETLSLGWELYFKYVDYVYDNNYNLTSNTGQYWYGSAWENS